MLKNFPIMLALWFMLSNPYYAENYAGIINTSLATCSLYTSSSCNFMDIAIAIAHAWTLLYASIMLHMQYCYEISVYEWFIIHT